MASPVCSRTASIRRSRASSARCGSTEPRADRRPSAAFSADRMVDAYLDVYESVLRDR